jgi:hypothetical protein
MSWICVYGRSCSANCRHSVLQPDVLAKDFVVFVVPLLEARLLYHIICHLTVFSGTSNQHTYKYATLSSNCLQPTGGACVCFDGCPRVASFEVCAGVRGLRLLGFVRVSEGCVFWCLCGCPRVACFVVCAAVRGLRLLVWTGIFT